MIKFLWNTAYSRIAVVQVNQPFPVGLGDSVHIGTGNLTLLRRPSKTAQPLVRANRPKPPNSSYVQNVQNRPVNSEFVGLSFTAVLLIESLSVLRLVYLF